jgi:hypothetical protein
MSNENERSVPGRFASDGESEERQKNKGAEKSSLAGAACKFPRIHFSAPDFFALFSLIQI